MWLIFFPLVSLFLQHKSNAIVIKSWSISETFNVSNILHEIIHFMSKRTALAVHKRGLRGVAGQNISTRGIKPIWDYVKGLTASTKYMAGWSGLKKGTSASDEKASESHSRWTISWRWMTCFGGNSGKSKDLLSFILCKTSRFFFFFF